MSESKSEKKPSSLAGTIFWIVFGVTVFSFAAYIIQINFAEGTDGVMKHGFRGNGAPLQIERALYIKHGFDISWMDASFLQTAREAIHPFFECIDLLLLRMYGLVLMIPILALYMVSSVVEGWLAYNEKILDASKVSSFRFHLSKAALAALFGFGFIFAVFPFGLEIPLLGAIPIVIQVSVFGSQTYFWLSNPYNMLVIMTVPITFLTYQIAANFSRNI
ncbi:DUF4400 domain-containing protein [Pseudodesulfovibrio pelocollis]|uniref:DUF4400 domain-containing protein n=1 Tax=Pseudodesulfovibrio pelocollis TaxID=3051432 RepID=UPI00255A91FF|nr:DUF4400 domain-containing protein [Pseudodesulfovibrio sp. SB368]